MTPTLPSADLDGVQAHLDGAGGTELGELDQTVLNERMVHVGVRGGADELADVALVRGGDMLGALAELNEALAVTDAGGGAVQHGGIELLGDLAGHLHEVLALLGIAGLDHGDLGGAGIVAVVLLVLGGMATGVVSGDDDVSAVHAM